MQIIPAINCQDFDCIKDKLRKVAEFGANWAQIDIADGIFTLHKTWNNPKELRRLSNVRVGPRSVRISPRFVEIHLMVENPFDVIDEWIEAGAKRIIIHLEAIKAEKLKSYSGDCEIGIAINPNTPIENLFPYLALIDKSKQFVQLLAVEPGLSGQKFQPQILDKIRLLKKNLPDVIIEVDGGINPETAKMCKEAGADILVAGSYIWESQNLKTAFKKLIEA